MTRPATSSCFRESAPRSRRSSSIRTARLGTNSQGGYALALAYDLLDGDQVRRAADHLVAAIDARDGHLSTGMVTTHLLLPALSKVGRSDAAYRLFAQKTYPSWGYFLKLGATSMWERWDAKTEKGFHATGMNSFNHANLGTCTEWFYRTVLGIDSQGPGFKTDHHPADSGRGSDLGERPLRFTAWTDRQRLVVGWPSFDLNVTHPGQRHGTGFFRPPTPSAVQESGKPAAQSAGVTLVRQEGGNAVFSVGSGNYAFSTPMPTAH